ERPRVAVVVGAVGRRTGPASLHQRGPGGGVVGALLGRLQRGLLLLADDRVLTVAATAAGERVEDSAEAVARADAEQHQAATEDDRETQVDHLHGAPAATAAEIEQHLRG